MFNDKQNKKDRRFIKKFSQGAGTFEIWVDTQTGVNYLYRSSGYSGGMTVLLDSEGKPVISKVTQDEENDFLLID